MDVFIEVAKTFGVPVALLAFFVWRDWNSSKDQKAREVVLGTRLDSMVDNHNRVTETTIMNNTAALNNTANAANNQAAATSGLRQSIQELKEELRDTCKWRQGH